MVLANNTATSDVHRARGGYRRRQRERRRVHRQHVRERRIRAQLASLRG